MQQITAPTNCPSCSSELETVNDVLYCRNNECPARGYKQVENFCKVLKIIGFGPATLQKLEVVSIADLYKLSEEYIIEVLGATLGKKLYSNLENSKKASLNEVLPALGIPLIGKTASEKICANINNITDITEELAKSTLGPKAAKNLLTWLEETDLSELPFSFNANKVMLVGEAVCITGKLKSFATKAAAAEYLTSLGYKVVDSITKNTKYLVNESGTESAKTKKAHALGITIVNNIKDLK